MYHLTLGQVQPPPPPMYHLTLGRLTAALPSCHQGVHWSSYPCWCIPHWLVPQPTPIFSQLARLCSAQGFTTLQQLTAAPNILSCTGNQAPLQWYHHTTSSTELTSSW